MKFWLRLVFLATFSVTSITAASADSSVSDLNDGVAAYRAGDYEAAWSLLAPIADEGAAKAKRYLGYMVLDDVAPANTEVDLYDGVALLTEAAVDGDFNALVRLEDLRRRHLAHSPSLEDMVAIEKSRAANGDPVAAWRLARRYEVGEGVTPSDADAAHWLEIAANANSAEFPKAGDAAYRLCELRALSDAARDREAAERWCAVAAENGHTGAAIVLKRLAMVQN